MSNTPPPASNPDDSIFGHILRVTKNSFTKCFGVVQTTNEYAKIKYKEHQMEARKKQFGVEFLKLIHDKASEEEKQACIDKALTDTAAIEKEIDVLKVENARVNAATNEKIVPKPGVTAPATTASSTAPINEVDTEDRSITEETESDSPKWNGPTEAPTNMERLSSVMKSAGKIYHTVSSVSSTVENVTTSFNNVAQFAAAASAVQAEQTVY
jgi:hypothetical protein